MLAKCLFDRMKVVRLSSLVRQLYVGVRSCDSNLSSAALLQQQELVAEEDVAHTSSSPIIEKHREQPTSTEVQRTAAEDEGGTPMQCFLTKEVARRILPAFNRVRFDDFAYMNPPPPQLPKASDSWETKRDEQWRRHMSATRGRQESAYLGKQSGNRQRRY